jgi:hypothetical protein
MSKKAIWTIIIFMTLSLIGVGVIQFMWIQRAVNLDEKNFNDKVQIALSNVKKRLQNDAENEAEKNYYTNKSLFDSKTTIEKIISEDIAIVGVSIHIRELRILNTALLFSIRRSARKHRQR